MDQIETISVEELKPKDRKDGYPVNTPFALRKALEIIPGVITWLFILSPLIVTLLGVPQILVFYIAFLTVFWAYRGIKFLYGLVVGYQRYNHDIKTDFMKLIKDEKAAEFEKLKFIHICPVVREDLEVLRPTIDTYAKSDIGPEKISIVFAFEEKYAAEGLERYQALKAEYGDKFKEFIYFIHPANISGEVSGVKGANINWAARNFVKLAEARGEDIHDYLLITCDSDQRIHPKYLSAITYKYLTVDDPDRKYYSTAIHTFNNNLWRVPSLIRIQSTTLTLALIHGWVTSKKTKDSFSSYVVNLATVREIGYWDPTVGIDDTTFYWNGVVRFKGDFWGEEVYIPTYNDAVENETHVKTYKSYYKQQLRWGWGIIVFPTTMAATILHKEIPFNKKLGIIWALIDHQILYLTVVYLITFGLPILGLINKQYLYSAASYNLPTLMSYLLTGLLFLNIPIIYLRRKIMPIPKGWPWWRYVLDIAETALITVNMLTFTFIPYIQAQTAMMFGREFKKKFYATEKVQIKSIR